MIEIWTPEQEASNLATLFQGVNKAAFVRANAVPGGPSMVNQHCSGNRPISLEAAIAYATGFGVGLEKISPRLAKIADQAQSLSGGLRAEEPRSHYGESGVQLTPDESKLLDAFRQAPPEGKAAVRQMLAALAGQVMPPVLTQTKKAHRAQDHSNPPLTIAGRPFRKAALDLAKSFKNQEAQAGNPVDPVSLANAIADMLESWAKTEEKDKSLGHEKP